MIFSKRTYKIKEEERTFFDFIPPFSILVGGLVFIIGTLTSIYLYRTPNGGYDFFHQFFSELGVRYDYTAILDGGGTEHRYAPENPEIFNFSLIVTGMLMMPFFLFSYRQMRNENRFSTLMLLISIVSGILAGPFLMGVGMFDLSHVGSNPWDEHGFWVAILYILLTLISITWLFMLLTARNLPYRTETKWIYMDYLFLLVLIVFTVINLVDGLDLYFVKDMPYFNVFPVETYQKLIAYIFFGYFGLVVGVRLSNTKYDNTPVVTKSTSKKTNSVDKSDQWFCTNCGQANSKAAEKCIACKHLLK